MIFSKPALNFSFFFVKDFTENEQLSKECSAMPTELPHFKIPVETVLKGHKNRDILCLSSAFPYIYANN